MSEFMLEDPSKHPHKESDIEEDFTQTVQMISGASCEISPDVAKLK
jgi:hypothetical protein